MAAIPFPPDPLSPVDHSVDPWVDPTSGQQWLWFVRGAGAGKWGRVAVDSSIISGSPNAVTGGAVFDALGSKQNVGNYLVSADATTDPANNKVVRRDANGKMFAKTVGAGTEFAGMRMGASNVAYDPGDNPDYHPVSLAFPVAATEDAVVSVPAKSGTMALVEDLDALGAAEILAKLQGVEANPDKIGAEYLPDVLRGEGPPSEAVASYVGQQYHDELNYVWYRWDGTTWALEAPPAAQVLFDPAGTIAATNVQAAIEVLEARPFYTPAQILSQQGEALVAVLQAGYSTHAGLCFFSTIQSAPGVVNVATTTGYARLINPDGNFGTIVSGSPGSVLSLTVPASGLHRAYGVMSVASGGSSPSGSITTLNINTYLTSFSGTGLSALTSLNLSYNQLTSFSGTGMSALTTLYIDNNQLTSFSGTGMSALTYLYMSANLLTSFSGTGLTSLQVIQLNHNYKLTSFLATGLTNLHGVIFDSCTLLKTLEGVGSLVSLAVLGSSTPALSFKYNEALTAEDFNNLFAALPQDTGTPATIDVTYTSGGPGCDPTIATAKGYTVNR